MLNWLYIYIYIYHYNAELVIYIYIYHYNAELVISYVRGSVGRTREYCTLIFLSSAL